MKNLLLSLAATALVLTACTNDDNLNPNEGTVFEGDGYLAVSLNLPTVPSTRAFNDNFDDGTAEEYKVDDAAIILFKGANEESATFFAAYELDNYSNVDDVDDDNITSSYLKTVKVQNITLTNTENLYGLAVINYKSLMEIDSNDHTLKIEGKAFASDSKNESGNVVPGNKLSDLFTDNFASSANFYKTDDDGGCSYFFMTNAPVFSSTALGGGKDQPSVQKNHSYSTLTKLTPTLYKTKEEAAEKPAASIYVERAVAKTTLSKDASLTTVNPEKDITLTISKVEWTLGNTEDKSYLVRNIGTFNDYMDYSNTNANTQKYRMVGHTAIGTTSIQPISNLYRTYWGIDPAYDKDKTYSELSPSEYKEATAETPIYCYENTFNVNHQNYKNSTRAVLKVTFDSGSTFYTINDDQTILYKKQDDAESKSKDYVINRTEIGNAVKKALKDGVINYDYTGDVEITFTRNETTGIREVTDIKFKNVSISGDDAKYKEQPSLNKTVVNDIKSKVNQLYVIREYTGGVSYYDLRIKHFGDELTPWTAVDGDNVTTVYPGEKSEENYLGRYGMLRNNWYDIKITKIARIGEPVVPDANTETSDDNQKSDLYLSFKINILSWAKRTNSYEL